MKKLLLFAFSLSLLFCGCSKVEKRTPLGWCLWEIQKHQDYEDVIAYTYEEPNYPIEEEYTGPYSCDVYIITTYTDELRTEWFCFIEYKTSKRYLEPSDVIFIDCDIAWEINMEEWGRTY